MNEGDLMGLTYEQVWQNYGHLNDSYESVNGESQQQAAARLNAFLKLLESDPCEYAAAFAHAGMMRCMMRQLLGDKVCVGALCNPNCNIAVFRWNGQRWSLAAWNPQCDF
jgi:broad specificity phosphatase PhoE